MELPDDVPARIEEALTALWYLARHPLRGPRRTSLAHARALDVLDRGGCDTTLRESDLVGAPGDRFLGIYSREGLLKAMRAHGLLDLLAARGFSRVDLRFDLGDPYTHQVSVFDGDPSRRVGEVVASRRKVDALAGVALPRGSEAIEIGWLTIENPDGDHRDAALPGQELPGLGLARAVIDMSLAGATHLGFAALLAIPAHYHLAWMYHPWYRPLDPRDEGMLLALRRATQTLTRQQASWAIARGEVTCDGAPWRWTTPTMCAPIDATLRARLSSLDYARAAMEAAATMRFALR